LSYQHRTWYTYTL